MVHVSVRPKEKRQRVVAAARRLGCLPHTSHDTHAPFVPSYLPPSAEYLSSPYDLPELFLCSLRDCPSRGSETSFLTFFSGHVAVLVSATL